MKKFAVLQAATALVVALSAVAPSAASAVGGYPFIPGDFTSLGSFTAAGTVVFDTDALTYGGLPGGVVDSGVAVFAFSSVTVPVGTGILAIGSRPLAVVSSTTIVIDGTVDLDGENSQDQTSLTPAAGAGGGAGGASPGSNPGSGPGGGQPGTIRGGSGGGGFGGAGGAGGPSDGGAGGPVYGDLLAAIQGGSGGASGTSDEGGQTAGGGGAGGGLVLTASTSITVGASGVVTANGGHGAVSDFGASGGGSGGGIVLVAPSVVNDGVVRANGGDGGQGGCCGNGGGGGGGRILIAAVASGSGVYEVLGGDEGTSGGDESNGRAGVDGAVGVITNDPLAFDLPPAGAETGPLLVIGVLLAAAGFVLVHTTRVRRLPLISRPPDA
jgi:hypothetical protein